MTIVAICLVSICVVVAALFGVAPCILASRISQEQEAGIKPKAKKSSEEARSDVDH